MNDSRLVVRLRSVSQPEFHELTQHEGSKTFRWCPNEAPIENRVRFPGVREVWEAIRRERYRPSPSKSPGLFRITKWLSIFWIKSSATETTISKPVPP